MMDLSEDLLKLIQIAIVVVGTLALYFSYINYNVTVDANWNERESMIIGNSLLSNNCLTYSGTKSLFDEQKLNSMQSDSSCLKKLYAYGYVDVHTTDESSSWEINMNSGGTESTTGETQLVVLVRSNSGEIKPAVMVVKV